MYNEIHITLFSSLIFSKAFFSSFIMGLDLPQGAHRHHRKMALKVQT